MFKILIDFANLIQSFKRKNTLFCLMLLIKIVYLFRINIYSIIIE